MLYNVRYKQKAIVPDKILIWCAIINRSVSQPYLGRVSGKILNSYIYTDNYLSKLLQFVNEHHANDDTII